MFMDERLEFCDATAVANDAGTFLLGDVIDLGNDGIDGNSEMWLVIETGTEIITGGSAGTVVFKLASDAQAAIAADTTPTMHLVSATLVTDDAAANSAALNAGGQILVAKLPAGTYERYLGILCVVGTTTITAGTINAFLTSQPPLLKSMPDAI